MQPSPNQPQEQFPQKLEPSPGNLYNSPDIQAGLKKQYVIQTYNAAGGNFYTIALFSLINSVISFFNIGLYFPIGLGVTQLIDAFSMLLQEDLPEARTAFFAIGVVLDLIIVSIVAIFGYFIKKQVKWLIVLGGVLYLLDGLLVLLFQDWVGAAFHAYFLFKVWQSWQAIQKLVQTNTPQSAIESPL